MMFKLRALCAAVTLSLALIAPRMAFAQAVSLPPGKTCFQATTGLTGMIGLLGAITPGNGGASAVYGGVPLTGGTGSGATANITVTAGVVTAVTIQAPGQAYTVGDVLSAVSANIGGVIGFSVPVSSTSINSSLAGGTVGMYVPNTLTFAQTWQDSGQVTLNTNPIGLDANGCALIFGTGTYRQILYDNLGDKIWDRPVQVAPVAPANVTLANGKIIVGNSSNVGTAVTMSGACTLTNAGVISCSSSQNYINAMSAPYNVVNTDVQGNCAANQAGLNAAKTAAIAANLPLYLGNGTIHTNYLDWDLTAASTNGFHVFGAGEYLTTLDERADANDTTCAPSSTKPGLKMYSTPGPGFNWGHFEGFSVLTDFDGVSCELGQPSNLDPFNISTFINVACRNNNSISSFHLGTGCLFHFVLNSTFIGQQCTAYANQSNYSQTNSATSVTSGTGAKTFTVPGGQPWTAGQFVTAFSAGKPTTVWMEGTVTSYSAGTLVMNVTLAGADGVGTTATDWTIHADGTMYGNALTCTQCQFDDFSGGSIGNADRLLNIPVGAQTQALTFNGTDFENCNICFYNQSVNAHAITLTGVRVSLWTQFMVTSTAGNQNQVMKFINPTLGSSATQFNSTSASNTNAVGVELDNGEPVWVPSPPFPATATNWYNYTAKPLILNISQGATTISAISITSIINGSAQTIGYLGGSGTFILGANDYITITYTGGPPTWAMRIVQ